MIMTGLALRFGDLVDVADRPDDLKIALREITQTLGFDHFALTQHVAPSVAQDRAIWLHDYPAQWADYYKAAGLGPCDPVHRASHKTSLGFSWSRLPKLIALTRSDEHMLAMGREQGIGDGYTVPAHVPGEGHGSCSFAVCTGRPLPSETLPLAQLAGLFAFEAARRLWQVRIDGVAGSPLTDRQRDCVLWAARGKSDWEISRILDISEETVARHIKQACERYNVNKRTLLAIRTLFDGTLTFTDIFRR
jgi:LuxR family quorum-sensing system transcriptional regulator CciR